MLKKIFESFEEDEKLIVLIEDLNMFPRFVSSINYYTTTVEKITHPTSCIMVLKMKHSEYLKFMQRLQAIGLNLKQRTFGLIDTLVELNKESTAK